jgi:hypothetical protein
MRVSFLDVVLFSNFHRVPAKKNGMKKDGDGIATLKQTKAEYANCNRSMRVATRRRIPRWALRGAVLGPDLHLKRFSDG